MNPNISIDKSFWKSLRKNHLNSRIRKRFKYFERERDFYGNILSSRNLTKKQYLDLKFKEEVDREYKVFSEQISLDEYSDPEPVTISKTSHPFFSKLNQFTSVANLLLFAMLTILLFDSFSYAAFEKFFNSKSLFHFFNITIAISILFCLSSFSTKRVTSKIILLNNQFLGVGLFLGFSLVGTANAQNAQSIPVVGRVVDGATPLPGFSVAVFTSDNGSSPYVDRGFTGSDEGSVFYLQLQMLNKKIILHLSHIIYQQAIQILLQELLTSDFQFQPNQT